MNARACGLLFRNSKVLLVKHKKLGEEYYVLPGGGVEKNESPSDAVVREFFEETGLKVKVSDLVFEKFSRRDNRDEYYFIIESDDSSNPSHLSDPDLLKGVIQLAEWVDLGDVNKITLFPVFVKELIMRLS